jgi:RNA polymerase sigma-70 factor (sigma-E family)
VVGPADEAAFRDFVAARSPALLRTAYLLTGDRGLAEDAVQSMFGRVYVSWSRIRHEAATDAYCRKALVREVSSWRRRRRVTHVLTAEVPDLAHHSVDEASEASESLRTAMLALPPRQRAVVVLRYFDDMSEADVATALGISRGSVKQHTHRALASLRAALGTSAELIEETDR